MNESEARNGLRELELKQHSLRAELKSLILSNGSQSRIREIRGEICGNRKGENGLIIRNRVLEGESSIKTQRREPVCF